MLNALNTYNTDLQRGTEIKKLVIKTCYPDKKTYLCSLEFVIIMIEFNNVTVADKALIQSYTLRNARQNCDLSFSNIISWRFLYNTEYAIVNDYLCFRFFMGHHPAYMLPLPKPLPDDKGGYIIPSDKDISYEVIDALRDDSIALGHPFLMTGIPSAIAKKIENERPEQYVFTANRNFFDYIYLREKLVRLPGKKLQSKRNHINKFKKLYPNYEYRALEKPMIADCLRLEEAWRKAQPDENADEELYVELRSMTRAFHRWDSIGLMGGTIWVDGTLIAFTFGMPINRNTFDVCIEKADITYEGAFAIINQEFVKRIPEQYTYINREEDLGLPGLRKSKLSYKPDLLLEKNVLTEKQPLERFLEQKAVDEETRKLWEAVFNDPEPFVNLYFTRVYQSDFNVTVQIDRKVVAALQALPFDILWKGSRCNTVYMSGICVDENYRRQHVGKSLLRQAHFSNYYKDKVFAALIPAEEWLYDWYGKLGYARVITSIPAPENAADISFEDFDECQQKKDCIILHNQETLDIAQEDIRLAGNNYKPQSKEIPAMLRVLNAKEALKIYAHIHPKEHCAIRVIHDRDIPMNNAYYLVEYGKVTQTDKPLKGATIFNIRQLADFLFKEEKAEMWLMLN